VAISIPAVFFQPALHLARSQGHDPGELSGMLTLAVNIANHLRAPLFFVYGFSAVFVAVGF